MTISSLVFAEGGYSPDRLMIFHTDTSFINNEVFGYWITDVLLPEIEQRRAFLHEKIGAFDDRAVLIMDGCSAHKIQDLEGFLAEKESK